MTKLDEAKIDRTFRTRVPIVRIVFDDEGRIEPVGNEVVIAAGDDTARVALKKVSELFVGSKAPPSFRLGPTDDYILFFAMIELTVVEYCRSAGRDEYDAEMERLYNHLRRRPDGHDANPLFSYLQAAVRLYMSCFDVSPSELEAVCRRLCQSARRFGTAPTSTSYCEIVGSSLSST